MNQLIKYITIPNFEEIQKELLECIDHDYTLAPEPHAFIYPQSYMLQTCPKFMSWILPISKMPIRLFRFYVTPPGKRLGAHVDGAGSTTVPFGINIPVANTKDTYHIFYDCAKDNLLDKYPSGGLGIKLPKNFKEMVELERLELLKPCFTNNSIMHSVENKSDKHRVMFTVRWIIHAKIGRTIEEVIDTDGLFE
jgi:hypothetical protein